MIYRSARASGTWKLVVRAIAVALVGMSVSGCYFTASMYEWASEGRDSVPLAVVRSAAGNDVLVIRYAYGRRRPLEYLAIEVPADWHSTPLQPSHRNRRVVELVSLITARAEGVTADELQSIYGGASQPIYRLSSRQVKRPVSGPRSGIGSTAYGFYRHRVNGALVDDLFAYHAEKGYWVRIGAVQAFRERGPRIAVAALLTPVTLVLDIFGWMIWIGAVIYDTTIPLPPDAPRMAHDSTSPPVARPVRWHGFPPPVRAMG